MTEAGDTLGARIFIAHQRLNRILGRHVSNAEFGRIIGEKLRNKSYSSASVGEWEKDESKPDIATVGIIAEICDVDPGWLAYGKSSKAPAPQEVFRTVSAIDALPTLPLERLPESQQTRVARKRRA